MKRTGIFLSLLCLLTVQLGCESHRDEDIQKQEESQKPDSRYEFGSGATYRETGEGGAANR